MMISRALLTVAAALATAVLAPASEARAQMASTDVVVVANANAKGSVELAKYYCAARNILPDDRLIILKTTPGTVISREAYNVQIREPVRKFLTKNGLKDKTRCLALIWGVPVRVSGSKPTDERRQMAKVYKTTREWLHTRMAVNSHLLTSVGVKFPQPRALTLRPLGKLFGPKAGGVVGKPKAYGALFKAFTRELARSERGLLTITDKAKRTIAHRQLLALRLEVMGLADLMKNLPKETFASLPTKDEVRRELDETQARLRELGQQVQTPETVREAVKLVVTINGVSGGFGFCSAKMKEMNPRWENASVDSELALLWEDGYRLHGATPNPMYWRLALFKGKLPPMPKRLVMTARIDGPTAADALRMIKDSLAAEKTGVAGKFYVDAGGKYPHYEAHLHKVADMIRKQTTIPVVLDKSEHVFAPGRCPDAALYVGWYSLQKYVPAFTWSRGAVGWHIASFEAVNLRNPKSNEWCVKMIQNGVAATLGAVDEPRLAAFPLPQDFFPLLLTGRYTLAECYWKTVPNASWRMTLIGDPLYNPFKLNPKLSVYKLPGELTGLKTPTTKSKRPR